MKIIRNSPVDKDYVQLKMPDDGKRSSDEASTASHGPTAPPNSTSDTPTKRKHGSGKNRRHGPRSGQTRLLLPYSCLILMVLGSFVFVVCLFLPRTSWTIEIEPVIESNSIQGQENCLGGPVVFHYETRLVSLTTMLVMIICSVGIIFGIYILRSQIERSYPVVRKNIAQVNK